MGEDPYEVLAPPPAAPAAVSAQPDATEDNNQYEPVIFPNAPAVLPPEKFDRKRLPQPSADEESATDLNSHSKKSKKDNKEDDKKKPTRKIVASGEKVKRGLQMTRCRNGASKKRPPRTTCNWACLVVSGVFAVLFFCGTILSVVAIVLRFDLAVL